MRRIPLAMLAVVIAAVACQETATSPDEVVDLTPNSERFGNPPPPPIDTGASFSLQPTAYRSPTWQPTYSMKLVGYQDDCLLDPETDFILLPTVPVTYMYDPAGNGGYLHFSDAPFLGIDTDANGMVRMRDTTEAGDFIGQDFTGKGKVRFIYQNCEFVINLENVSDTESHFGECGPNVDLTQDPPEGRDQGCFVVTFEDIEFENEPTMVDVTMFPAPPPCDPDSEECEEEPPPDIDILGT